MERSRPTKINVVAWLVGEQPGRMLTNQADMDTLPIQTNDVGFAAESAGAMRACGHKGDITRAWDG